MRPDNYQQSLSIMKSDVVVATGWSNLSLELRQAIWALVYGTQVARVVEVATTEHTPCNSDHDWCPRFSPSPRPVLVNVCHEARSTAHNIAQRVGHLIFPPAQDTGTTDIYFNPEIDTLFVRNDKNHWIRDWGREGILTQMWKMHHPESLRSLAIELEPLSRATMPWSLHVDLSYFTQITDVIFVVKQDSDEVQKQFRLLDRERESLVEAGLSGYARPRVPVSSKLGVFKLARIDQGSLNYIPSNVTWRSRPGQVRLPGND